MTVLIYGRMQNGAYHCIAEKLRLSIERVAVQMFVSAVRVLVR